MERGRYVGQYEADFVQVSIRHGELVLVPADAGSGGRVTVRLTRDGPPKKLLVAGEVTGFFR